MIEAVGRSPLHQGRKPLSWLFRTPAGLMMSVWASYLLFYFLSLIEYNRSFSAETMLFLSGCLLIFIFGTSFGKKRSVARPAPQAVGDRHVYRVIRFLAFLG